MKEINKRDIILLKQRLKSLVNSLSNISEFDKTLVEVEKMIRADERAKVVIQFQDGIRKLFAGLIN